MITMKRGTGLALLCVVVLSLTAVYQYTAVRKMWRGLYPRGECNVYRDILAALDSEYTDLSKLKFDCVSTRTTPSAVICLYPDGRDEYVSKLIRSRGSWELPMVTMLLNKLNSLHDPVFIDAGANIGGYTNIIAKKHRVVSIEPNLQNVRRLHQGLVLSRVRHNVTIINNGLSDRRGKVKVIRHRTNQGMTHLDTATCASCASCANCSTIRTILLDDLLEVIPAHVTNVVIKMDIQGHEVKALRHAGKLFGRKLVQLFVMEWDIVKTYRNDPQKVKRIDKVMDFLYRHRLRPYPPLGGSQLNRRQWYAWPYDVAWRRG